MTDDLVKIRFYLDRKDWHGQSSEALWAEAVTGSKSDSVFRLRNTPFFVLDVSFLDTVRATCGTYNPEELDFAEVIDRSGHSTYMILVSPPSADFDEYWAKLQKLGCSYESKTQRTSLGEKVLYAVDVPPSSNIYDVYRILEDGEKKNIWMFQEGHVGHKLKSA